MFGVRSRSKPQAPQGQKPYAAGDIHGRLGLLDHLLDAIGEDHAAGPPTEPARALIFLGDSMDRGLHSAVVVDRLLAENWAPFDPYFLEGNHEAALLRFLERPETDPCWMAFGGAENPPCLWRSRPVAARGRWILGGCECGLTSGFAARTCKVFQALGTVRPLWG
jgi:hypothetical protein